MNSFLMCMHVHVCVLYQATFFRDKNGQSDMIYKKIVNHAQ